MFKLPKIKRKIIVSPDTTKPILLYKTLKELPLERFVKCIVDGSYDALKVNEADGIDSNTLFTTWIGILSQYYEAKKDATAFKYIELMSSMNYLTLKITTTNKIIECLEVAYNARFCELLQDLEFDYPLTEESYIDDLEKVKVQLIEDEMQYTFIEQKYKELEADKEGTATKATEEMFLTQIMLIQKHLGYCTSMTPREAMSRLKVDEYAMQCMAYEAMVKQSQMSNHGR